MDNYLRTAADLHAGRQPRQATLSADALTVKDVCNQYLNYQLNKVEGGIIRPATFDDCRATVVGFAKVLGPTRAISDLGPLDFQRFRGHISRYGTTGKSKGLGVYAETRAVTIIRGMFNYVYEADLIDKPIKYGPWLKKPSSIQMRKARNAAELENGRRLFEPDDIRLMLQSAEIPLRAMILLGINGGFGNTDCARLPIKAVDFDHAVIEFSRPKTGVERVVPIWPETIKALCQALANRPKPVTTEAERLFFVTTFGRAWVRENVHLAVNNGIRRVVIVDAIGQEFDKILRCLGLKRRGIGFYTLRHTFRTWADEVQDQHAIHRIMGHSIPGMSGVYVEKIEPHRLQAVVEHVRAKILDQAQQESTGSEAPPNQRSS